MEECRRLQGMACQISMAFLLYFVGLTIYAARRRTELRERFNIAGAARPCIRDIPCPCIPMLLMFMLYTYAVAGVLHTVFLRWPHAALCPCLPGQRRNSILGCQATADKAVYALEL